MNDYTVYIHTNKINNMKYIGITHQDVSVRWQAKGNGYRKQQHFWRAIKKYGWDNFEHEIVAQNLTYSDACELEVKLIEKYQTRDNAKGYNKSIGGESGAKGVKKSQKQLAASSDIMKTNWRNPAFREACRLRTIAMNKTETIRKKRSESGKKRIVSEETKKRIANAKRGKKRGPFTKEHIQHMKENHAGGADKSAVICIDTNERFESINDAAREKGINKKGISGCCRKVPHYNTAGGYRWRFANEG